MPPRRFATRSSSHDSRLRGVHGNPSSVHEEGRSARAAVDRARESVASLVGVEAEDVLFTAGATEANNTALLGMARSALGTRLGTS